MTERSKRVGVFVGAGMLIAATTLGAHTASQNISVIHQRSAISEFVVWELQVAKGWSEIGRWALTQAFAAPGSLIAQAAGGLGFQGGPGAQGGPGFGRGRSGGPGGPGMIELPLGRLNLSAQQQDQVQAITQSHQDEMKALGDRAMAAQDALQAAVTADTIDDNTIRARSANVAAVDADMAIARAHVRGEVLQVLTTAQRAQAKQIQAEMEAARPPRPGRGGRGR